MRDDVSLLEDPSLMLVLQPISALGFVSSLSRRYIPLDKSVNSCKDVTQPSSLVRTTLSILKLVIG